jgi:hypothetical protein
MEAGSSGLKWVHFSQSGVLYEPWSKAASELSTVYYCPICGAAHAQSINPVAGTRWIAVAEPCSAHFAEPLDVAWCAAFVERGHPKLDPREVMQFLLTHLEKYNG